MKAVTGEYKLSDGCSVALCSAKVSVVSADICHINKVIKSIQLHDSIVGLSQKILSSKFTFTFIAEPS